MLMGYIGGVRPAKVVVLGCGTAGLNAVNVALGMGADVTVLDTDLGKLWSAFWRFGGRVRGLASSTLAVREEVLGADLVVDTVLVPGARAPKLVKRAIPVFFPIVFRFFLRANLNKKTDISKQVR